MISKTDPGLEKFLNDKNVSGHYKNFLKAATDSKKGNLFGYSSKQLAAVCAEYSAGFASKGVTLFYCSNCINVCGPGKTLPMPPLTTP